jgi:hypothetical protein
MTLQLRCRSPRGSGLLSCRNKKVTKETPTRSLAALRAVPCAPRLSRALRNSPESKNDSGSNSARALLRLKLRCSASSDGGTSTPTATCDAICGQHLTHPTQSISRFSVTGVAVDVGTRSRRRASQPRPGGFASRCLSRARLFALGEFGSRPAGARSAGGVGGSGVCFLLVTFLCTSKEK